MDAQIALKVAPLIAPTARRRAGGPGGPPGATTRSRRARPRRAPALAPCSHPRPTSASARRPPCRLALLDQSADRDPKKYVTVESEEWHARRRLCTCGPRFDRASLSSDAHSSGLWRSSRGGGGTGSMSLELAVRIRFLQHRPAKAIATMRFERGGIIKAPPSRCLVFCNFNYALCGPTVYVALRNR